MASRKEIKEHLEIAFDDDVNEWVFSHANYPVEYGGQTPEEVVKNYPKYLQEFIKHRLDNRLNPLTEKKTKGHGGKREGAGRPKGSVKKTKERISLPKDLASWFKNNPQAIDLTRKMMHRHVR